MGRSFPLWSGLVGFGIQRTPVDRCEPSAGVVDLPVLELSDVEVERDRRLGVSREALHLGHAHARASEVRDRGVPQIVERELGQAILVVCLQSQSHSRLAPELLTNMDNALLEVNVLPHEPE